MPLSVQLGLLLAVATFRSRWYTLGVLIAMAPPPPIEVEAELS